MLGVIPIFLNLLRLCLWPNIECVLEKNVCFAQTIFNLKLQHFDPMISLGTPVILFKALFMYLNNNMLEDALYFLKDSFPKRSTLTLPPQ